ncbi:hypothetical protein OE749_16685 [Aestuariibacter sp. AA17]|uniref:DUF2341 domain-containing protein n=1 Tax=Fluctibacter corallii TaxID=2984329 RepID=A0ABT3ACH3_9ALTE|nr:hypothetical protein [Aestuariibacter sp. AA17]MCV2886333.1 hypothetical protein [Aestuariibacter sp. AA17]
MKKFLGAALLLLTSNALAGEAIIPFWQANAHASYTLSISNVSATDAEVEVELRNKDGSLFNGSYSTDNGGAINTPFVIPANQTVWIWVQGSGTTVASTLRGYGVIKSTEAKDANGKSFIVAYGKYDRNTSNSTTGAWMAVPINNGMPF